jgi:hypothetical protein
MSRDPEPEEENQFLKIRGREKLRIKNKIGVAQKK